MVAIAGFTLAAVLTDTAASGWPGCAAPVGCTEGDEPANRLLAAIRISEMILHTASNAIFEASRSTPDKQEWDRKEFECGKQRVRSPRWSPHPSFVK